MIEAKVAIRPGHGTYGLVLRHGDDVAEFRLPRMPKKEHGHWRPGSTAYVLTEDEYAKLKERK